MVFYCHLVIANVTIEIKLCSVFFFLGHFISFCFCLYRIEKEWKELQIAVGELFEARPEEGADNPT